MDGIEATREIRESTGDTRILMLTGSNSRDGRRPRPEGGAAGYVTKDRIAAELIEAIVEISDRR